MITFFTLKLWLGSLLAFIRAYWQWILAAVVLIFALIGFYSFCGKTEKPIDNEQLIEQIEREREKDTQNFNAQESRTNEVLSNADAQIKQAEANTEKAKGKKGNVTGAELDKMAGER